MAKTSQPQSYSEAALQLNAVFESAIDGIITIREDGVMEWVNPAAARLFGYTSEEMAGHNVSMLMPAPHRQQHDHYIQRYLQTGQARIIGIGREVQGLRKDGSLFPLRLSISEVTLSSRRFFTGILHDLSEEKAAERALEQEKKRAQRYLDVANTTIVVIDREGCIQLINKRGAELLGYPEEEILRQNWFELAIPPVDQEITRQLFRNLLFRPREASDYYENEIITATGEKRLIAWRNAPIFDDEGQVEGFISSGIDITEQRAAEERIIKLNTELEARVDQRTEELALAVNQLLDINKKLEYEIQERKAAESALRKSEQELRKAYEKEKELSELKSRFVSMASHEFRTPLSTILSSADLIEAYTRYEQQPRREKHTQRIKLAVTNLTGILNDFLSLSRLEEGKLDQQPTQFELRAFCLEILDELQGLLKTGQVIRHHLPTNETSIKLDRKVLKNIFFNLLSNAIKYSDDGQPIDCRVEIEDGRLFIAITDQGIGIPEEEQQYLFTRFFRAHNVENIQGTGLGLNIVKRYVDIMGGEVSFHSKLGEGSTFYVTLPLVTD